MIIPYKVQRNNHCMITPYKDQRSSQCMRSEKQKMYDKPYKDKKNSAVYDNTI